MIKYYTTSVPYISLRHESGAVNSQTGSKAVLCSTSVVVVVVVVVYLMNSNSFI